MEKQVRQELRRTGTEEFVKNFKKDFEDRLAEGADQVGSITGRKDEAERFIEKAVTIASTSQDQQRRMKRPDLFPEHDSDPNRRVTGQSGPKRIKYFYPGKKGG